MNAKDFLDPLAMVWMLLLGIAVRSLIKGNAGARKYAVILLLVPVIELCGVSVRLVASLEAPYIHRADAPVPSGCEAVVVCGGMLQASPEDFTGANYFGTVDRFLTGVEMARRFQCPLVLGGGESGGMAEPLFLKRWVKAWNLTDLDIRELGVCRDTRDEAVKSAAMARQQSWSRVLLITSASHLPRASATFRRAGLAVTPYGCDFDGTSALQHPHVNFLPSCASANRWRCWITEMAGLWYYRCRGWA